MADFDHIVSRPYKPKECCTRCLYGEDVPHHPQCKNARPPEEAEESDGEYWDRVVWGGVHEEVEDHDG